jgi:type I restriction enzyme, S subunit
MIFDQAHQDHRLKWAFTSCKNGAWGNEPDGEGDVVCIRAADFDGQLGRLNDGDRTFRSVDPETYKRLSLSPGDIIVEKSGGGEKQLVGRAVLFNGEEPSITSNFLARCRPSPNANPAFLNYLLLAIYNARGTFPHLKQSTGIQNLDLGSLLDVRVRMPPLETQLRIARFLDEKTTQIDRLIEKKRALRDRLGEKLQTHITRAVTKGLDPAASMKPSGIDWLGDIPAHWEVLPLKRKILHIEQGWSPSADERVASEDEWGVLKSGCVNGGVYDDRSHKTLPSLLEPRPYLEVLPGDILMCRASGSLKYIGSVALVAETRPRLMFSDKTYRLTLSRHSIEKRFFVYSMASKHLREQIILSVSGAEGLANNIAQSSVGRYIHSFPPMKEQDQIANYLDRISSWTDEVVSSVSMSIARLYEYRAALITSAVTGRLAELQ